MLFFPHANSKKQINKALHQDLNISHSDASGAVDGAETWTLTERNVEVLKRCEKKVL